MKFLDKLGLAIFSTLILALSVLACLMIAEWISVEAIAQELYYIKTNIVAERVTIGFAIGLSLLAIKCIFFNSFEKEENKSSEGILLENENGKLLVSRNTIENIANGVIKNFQSAENVETRVDVDEENNLSIFVTLSVYENAIIKDLIIKIQKDVKEAIKKSIDLEIKEVNVRVKNLAIKKETIEVKE